MRLAASRLPIQSIRARSSASRRSSPRAMATAESSAYSALCERLREANALSSVAGLLGWDEQVMMPPAAAELRSQQQAALAGVVFEKETSPALGELLAQLTASPPADKWERAVVRDAARDYKRRTALSKELAQREARLQSDGYHAWAKARKEDEYSSFQPLLAEWVALTREKCAAIDPSAEPYDVCLDGFERGLLSGRVDEVFAQVRDGIVPLLAEVKAKGRTPDIGWLQQPFDAKKQAALCESIAVAMGFDLTRGRLDVSVHPFTGGAGPSDVRMTTRFKECDVMEGLTGAIHETGHALYEMGRPGGAVEGLPVSSALSMGMHESQSLLWERCIGLSRPFAAYLLLRLRETFPGAIPEDKTAEDLYIAMNVVSTRSLIRVEADELSYPLHVILRYELESALVRGQLSVAELPAAWNAKMESYLGVTPPTNREGCLQDVHWSSGAFGYFPTYTLGAMMAVQIFDAARAALPTLDADIEAGRFAPLREWLRANVHSKGSLYPSADELMIAATGSPLRPEVYLDFMRKKYSELYGL